MVVNDSRGCDSPRTGREETERRRKENPPPLHKCIRREFCNCQYPSTGISVPVHLVLRFIRAYVKARSLLTVRAQRADMPTATCRSTSAGESRLEELSRVCAWPDFARDKGDEGGPLHFQ